MNAVLASACVFLATRGALESLASATNWSTVVFDSPTVEPSKNGNGLDYWRRHAGGNGKAAALVFPVTKPFSITPGNFELKEGVHFIVSMPEAMASDMSLMPLGVVSLVTDPPLGTENFKQTLFLQNASVQVSTSVATIDVWVDASTNRIIARTTPSSSVSMRINATVTSLRPSERFSYKGRCSTATSAPDFFEAIWT